MVDSILSLNQSGKITARSTSCTDTPLSLASSDNVRNDSSRRDSMNFTIADNSGFFCSKGSVYNNLYTIRADQNSPLVRLENLDGPSSICSEGLVENCIAVETDQCVQMFGIG